MTLPERQESAPLYQQVKDYIVGRILAGKALPPRDSVLMLLENQAPEPCQTRYGDPTFVPAHVEVLARKLASTAVH